MSNQAVATQKDVKSLIQGDQFKAALSQALPRHMTPEKMVRVVITAAMRQPKLWQCDSASLTKAILDCAAAGLEPDGFQAHLIPFWNGKRNTFEVQTIFDYKGLIQIARRSGELSTVMAEVVCENDEFEHSVLDGVLKITHKINHKKSRGNMYAAYAVARFKDGGFQCEVMTKEEVDSTRSRSKSKDNGPWVSDYNEMAKKTVFRRLSKWLPRSAELATALERDHDAIDIESTIETGVDSLPPPTFLSDANPPATVDEQAPPAQKKRGRPATKISPDSSSPSPAAGEPTTPATPQGESGDLSLQLYSFADENGLSFETVVAALKEVGLLDAAINPEAWGDIPSDVCSRALKAKAGLLNQLK